MDKLNSQLKFIEQSICNNELTDKQLNSLKSDYFTIKKVINNINGSK